MSTTTIKYDAAKSRSTAATVADFVRTDESELHDAPLTTIPGIGEVTAELFDDLATARELITKFRRFNRANRNHDEVAQRFFKWLREEIGGSFNKHTVTEAVENWVLEHVTAAADASSSDEISYDPSKSGTSVSLVADFCRMSMRDLRNEELTTVPGIGDASAELFEEAGIRTVKELIRKYKSFARGRNKHLAAEKFFQWQRANVGGTYNKHSVTNAVENYILETIHEEPWI